ncbi:hypothetical protein RISW2_10935 [Roseivivax isoporae LMG 25204]|uniref:Amidase domain-containing protein n=2 Tax=Roseivivax TaxID=93682 RepID=X7F4V0_9RHOB|nr:hypothetical protein RISW2_10935 [Roseivivax isoporae LMG 25204]
MATRTELSRGAAEPQDPSTERLKARDGKINAFVEVLSVPRLRSGALSYLRFGVKEVIEQEGLATPPGMPFLRARLGRKNAAIVDRVQSTGAARVGTTRSTMLAIAGDSGTRNPHDLCRTPGGSSAGSAAAVAAGFIDFALGTQTVGSIIRPASYCGVVGFKPTFDALPTLGVMRLAAELDHVGLIGRDAGVVARVFDLLSGSAGRRGAFAAAWMPPIWFSGHVHPSVRRVLEDAASRVRQQGMALRDDPLPENIRVEEADILQGLLCKGIVDNHRALIESHASRLPSDLVEMAKAGARISGPDHRALRRAQRHLQTIMYAAVADDTVIIVPSVVDVPPVLGRGTGSRAPQRLWTLLGWPAVSLPLGTYGGALAHLPMGVQMIAKPGRDAALLDFARHFGNPNETAPV